MLKVKKKCKMSCHFIVLESGDSICMPLSSVKKAIKQQRQYLPGQILALNLQTVKTAKYILISLKQVGIQYSGTEPRGGWRSFSVNLINVIGLGWKHFTESQHNIVVVLYLLYTVVYRIK